MFFNRQQKQKCNIKSDHFTRVVVIEKFVQNLCKIYEKRDDQFTDHDITISREELTIVFW